MQTDTTLLDVVCCVCLHSLLPCCHVFLGVVAQSLKPVKLLAMCKQTQLLPMSCCVLLQVALKHFLWCVLWPFVFLFEPKIQDAVSDPNIGRMRLQFWRDSLDNIYQVKWNGILLITVIARGTLLSNSDLHYSLKK